uniref:Uncharacterized protein n=1 Tax=Arundo donax TaxID=35708 RepID=A0A0A8ZZH7_ARUDO
MYRPCRAGTIEIIHVPMKHFRVGKNV